ncbi:MAG: TIGR03435 family protein [Acidobacteriota bacterium]|nr:TIGR03435 family protein [Acidobacteriota bacterium]
MRRLILLSVCFLPWGRLHAQQPPGRLPTFAVATIRPSSPDVVAVTQIRGNRFASEGTTFVDVFKYAYNVHPDQVVGGPEWLRTQRFDILADPETEKRPSSDQMKALVQQLLVERFHLVMHQEQKVLSVYALVKAVDAPKLTKSTADSGGIPAVAYNPKGELHAGNATMANFATFLQRFVLDRPAVDETGIAGRFDVALRWTPDSFHAGGKADDPQGDALAPPSLFTAIKEQLGLKLQPTKAPASVYVIDRVDQPSAD